MKHKEQSEMELSLLSYREVQKLTGLSRSTIHRQMKRGIFPRPKLLASRKRGFLLVELQNWLEHRDTA
jgi:predicted DNA-binding transcriptional regulator AlpA